MRRRLLWIFTAVFLAVLLCLALYYYTPASRKESGTITLWYAETDCPRPVMEALLDRYRQETGCIVTAAAFPDEAALAAAFETGRPDLLLCSHVRAWDIESREGLTALKGMPPLPESVREIVTEMGGCFFPFGARLPLLLMDSGRFPEPPESLEALLAWAAEVGKPAFAADSWADLLYQGMLSQGKRIEGSLKADLRDRRFTKLYNDLAACAYAGGFALVSDGADYVRQGLLPCAAVSSSALAGLEDGEGLAVSALPPPEGGRKVYSTELMGFAVLAGKKTVGEAEEFLTWLAAGDHSPGLALSAGLVPLAAFTEEQTEQSAFESLLCKLAEEKCLRFIDPGSDYCKNRNAMESRLRQSLDLLA